MSAPITEAKAIETAFAKINVDYGYLSKVFAERDALRAEVERLRADHHIETERAEFLWKARAEKAEAELAALKQSVDASYVQFPVRMTLEAYIQDAKTRDDLRAELAKEQARSSIHASFCDDALTLCEDTGIAGNIIAKMRELRKAAINAAREAK